MAMQIDLSDEEAAALLALLNRTIENDRYPLSPRIQILRGILAKLAAVPKHPHHILVEDLLISQ